jgi:hypothetical protein
MKIDIGQKITEALLITNKEVSLDVNAEKRKYTFKYCEQNEGQNNNIKAANKAFENVTKFKYFGKTVTNKNCMYQGIKEKIKFRSFLLHCRPESFVFPYNVKNTNIKLSVTIILPAVLYERENLLAF